MPRNFAQLLYYDFLHVTCRLGFTLGYHVRVVGRDLVPPTGPLVMVSNHQSFLDPILIGLACDRRLNFVARDTLFRSRAFSLLLRAVRTIPIDREGMSLSGIKETLKRLKEEEAVVLFPEGTRTADGHIKPFKPGFSVLARRTNAPLSPAAIAGAWQAWPRERMLPRLGRIRIHFGPPLMPAEFAKLSDEELVAEMQRRVQACYEDAMRLRDRVL